jgi:protein-S-isoprenylcysteine O-methyltransferase Ste14
MRGVIAVFYGLLAYGLYWAAFLYTIGFVGNLFVPKSIDSVAQGTLGQALLIDCGLFLLFALQHSLMARKWFKAWWTRLVPPPIERSTYVLVSSLLLLFLFWQWRPIPAVVWELEYPPAQRILEVLFWLGWLIALHSIFLIDHRDFFGVRQVWLYACRKPYDPVKFKMPDLYRYVRHPLMMGLLMAFWATPVMTLGHFVFAAASTVYILIGIRLEERDLGELYGEAYQEYCRRVSMLIPLPRRK